MILNLGCGVNKMPNAINLDIEKSVKPDVLADFTKPLPFPDDSVEKVYFFHVIEHLPKRLHPNILLEIWRVMTDSGVLYVAYPEFVKCAQNFIDNKKGMREFWAATIYGRQLYPADTHISLMYTPHFEHLLVQLGFKDVKSMPEVKEDYNTIVRAVKGKRPLSQEEIWKRDLF
jgi:ubiquinone/menaquinone biosynthesis C-methylase UbiE